jgi:ribosomal protein S26
MQDAKFSTYCEHCKKRGNFTNFRCENCGKEVKTPKGVSKEMHRKYLTEQPGAEFDLEYMRRKKRGIKI